MQPPVTFQLALGRFCAPTRRQLLIKSPQVKGCQKICFHPTGCWGLCRQSKREWSDDGGGREAEQASLRRRQLGTWRWESAGLYRTWDTRHSIILSDEYHCCVPFPDEETGAKEIKMLSCKLKIGVQESGDVSQWLKALTALLEASQHPYRLTTIHFQGI